MTDDHVYRRTESSSNVYHADKSCRFIAGQTVSTYRQETAEYWNNLDPCSECVEGSDD